MKKNKDFINKKDILNTKNITKIDINNKTSLIKFNFQNKTYNTIERIIHKITKKTLLYYYDLSDDLINRIIKVSHKMRRLNTNNDDFKNIYKPRFKNIMKYEDVFDFFPFDFNLDNFNEHYVHTFQKIIDDIYEYNIHDWSRKHVYYTSWRNCLQLIQLQKHNNIYYINYTFRSQSYKCFWLDLIQFVLPLIDNIIHNWWEIWDITFMINNLHE